jgi:hypothetical protein
MPHTENEEQYIEDRIEYVLKNQGVSNKLIQKYLDDIEAFDDLHPYIIMKDEDIIEDFRMWNNED